MVPIRICKVHKDAHIPQYMTPLSAGMDLHAVVAEEEGFYLWPGEHELIATGLVIEIPEGFEGQVRPRSGLAAKGGVTVLNSPGTIDADYRGEVKVILINLGRVPLCIKTGDRIAQLVIAPVTRVQFEEVANCDDLSSTDRGSGGCGSTGV